MQLPGKRILQEVLAGACLTTIHIRIFGSGDRICYHGVMDMFRNPKLAAAVYACQQEKEPVLEISSSMDIGEHPGCNRGTIWIFTNADSVRMYKNDRFLRSIPHQIRRIKILSHGPIAVDDFIGDAIEKEKDFKPEQARKVKYILNAAARYGAFRSSERRVFGGIEADTHVSHEADGCSGFVQPLYR